MTRIGETCDLGPLDCHSPSESRKENDCVVVEEWFDVEIRSPERE